MRILGAPGKAGLAPAAERWVQQYKDKRPLEVRLAPASAMHDRLIVIDGKTVWSVGQSFNKLAERAHTSIIKVEDSDTTALKLRAYSDLWNSAAALQAK